MVFEVPEADQEIGADADALPTDEHDEQVVAQHQHQHREREKVQIQEEALKAPIVAVVVVHVADRVEMNQEADAADDKRHHRRERIEEERELRVKRIRADPGVDVVHQEARFGFELRQTQQRVEGNEERQRGHRARQADHDRPRQLALSKKQPEPRDRRSKQRE